ncbi:hypothetical protein [Bosea sp. LjRoot237]
MENVRWRALPERFGNWNTVWRSASTGLARRASSRPSSMGWRA